MLISYECSICAFVKDDLGPNERRARAANNNSTRLFPPSQTNDRLDVTDAANSETAENLGSHAESMK
jgi:hypothetical protein